MERSQDWCGVISAVKTTKKSSCCILNELEAREWLFVYARKEEVTVVKSQENKGLNEFFQVRVEEHWFISRDGSYLKEAGLDNFCYLWFRALIWIK